MIGVRAGIKTGIRAGQAVGVSSDPIAPDATGTTTTLTVALTDSADPVLTQLAFSYALVVTNTGAADATTVTATVTLDASLAYVSASGTGWAVDASAAPLISFTRATLAVGAAPTITINVTSGGSALTASSAGNATAANASPATTSTQTTVVKLVAKDSTAGIYLPASSTQWTDFIAYFGLAIGVPDSLWLCQEASGNLADSIGSLTLTAANAPSYNTAVAGYTRLGVSAASNSTSRFAAAAAVGPNPTTTSSLWFALTDVVTGPGASKQIVSVGGATTAADACAMVTVTTGALTDRTVNVSTSGSASIVTPGVIPIIKQYDRANSNSAAYSLAEKVTGTYSALVTDGNKGLFAMAAGTSAGATVCYMPMWSGAKAEISSATIKAMLTAMGFAPAWS